MHDVIYLLCTALIGLIVSFLVVTVLNIGGRGDDALNRDVQQLLMQCVSSLTNVVFIPVLGLWNLGIDLGTMATMRAKWSVALVLLTVAALMMHYYHAEILSILDDSWKCFLIPLMDNIVEPFLQISRVFYAIVMPFVNLLLVMHAQVLKAWYVTLTACSHINMFQMFNELARALVTGTGSFVKWFHDSSKLDPTTNTFYYNDFVIERPVNHTLTALSIGQEVVACACKRFEPLFNIGFFITQEPHVTAVIDNMFQFVVRLLQMFFRTLLSEFPDIYKATFKLERGITELGLSLDSIMFNTVGNLIKMFDKDFRLERWPHEGVFTMLMHLASGAIHVAATVFVNGPLHMMASFDPDVSALDPKVWDIQPAIAKMYKAVNSGAVLLQWMVWVFEQMIVNKQDLSAVFSATDSPLELQCDWARDVDDHRYVKLSYTVGCTSLNLGLFSVNTVAIVTGAVSELLLKSIFTQEQNVFRTLQRWEGPSLPRKKVYSCEERKAATAYDYELQRSYPEGWIWTQDRNLCGCDLHYGSTADEDEPAFNPWCGQPSLNMDIFGPLDALVMHVSHGVLGPGFGDAMPFIRPLRSIDINIEQIGVDKTIALPLTLPPLTRTAIESARVLTRVVLSFGDIVTGHFFNYPVNCGHGLNNEQLIARYKSDYPDAIDMPSEDRVLRWKKCKEKAYSALSPESPGFASGDSLERMQVCDTSNNNADCMCSYMQPLEAKAPCRCIARYPDIDVTASSQEVGDLIEDRFTSSEVSMHWCNSMIIEWTFQNTAAFADALDYIVSLGPINPTCDVIERITGLEKEKEVCAMSREEAQTTINDNLGCIRNMDALGSLCDAMILNLPGNTLNDALECRVDNQRLVGQCGSLVWNFDFESFGECLVAKRDREALCDELSRANADASAALACHDRNAMIGSGERDQRSTSTYKIATTPTLDFVGEFATAETKLNHISDLFSQRPTGCSIVEDADGRKEWACDVSDGTALSEIDTTLNADDAGCKIYGRTDFFCSAGLYVRNHKRVTMNIARQVVNDGISLIAGNFADVNVNALPRLCDYERQQGALAAMFAGLIPGLPSAVQIAVAKYVNIILQVTNVHVIRIVLTVVNMASRIVQSFAMNTLDEDSITKTFQTGVKTILNSYVFLVRDFWQTTGEFLDAVSPGTGRNGAGKICFDIVAIINIIAERFERGLLDLLTLIVKTFLQGIAILSGDTEQVGEFMENSLEVIEMALKLVIENAFAILNKLFEFFGPIGEFFKILSSTVCVMLNGVMNAINFALFGILGWEDMKCPPILGAERSHAHFKKHFLKAEDDHILQRVADTLDWNGTSTCDHFMTLVGDYKYSDLRPLEHAKWYECLEMKLIGVEMGRFVGSRAFPTDIMYNWKRKYMMIFEMVRALRIAIPHFLVRKSDWGGLRMSLNDVGIDADMYMSLFRVTATQGHKLLNSLEATNMLKVVLESVDPLYDNPENPSNAARAWRIFQNTKSMYNDASTEWVNRDMSKSMWEAVDATNDAQTHLHRWWNTLGTEHQAEQTHTEKVFADLKSRWHRTVSERVKSTPQHNVPHWLGVPIKTRPLTCGQRSSPEWCTECSIVDNIIEQAVEHTEGMSQFYTLYFPRVLSNVSTYFNSMVESNVEFFDRRFSKLASTSSEQVVPTTAVRWTTHVANDWEYLATNFTEFVTNHSHKEQWLAQVSKFLSSTRKWFTYVDDSYVPFFGYSLYHVYDTVLFSACDVEHTIFIPLDSDDQYRPQQEQRLDAMDTALIWCLVLALVVVTNTSWSVIPLVWLANTLVLGMILSFVYLNIVYSWQVSCAPLLPYTLMEDIYAWYDTRLQTGCFYKILPFMALEPSEDMCRMCSAPDPWQTEQIRINNVWKNLNQSTWNATTGESQFTQMNKNYYDIELGQRQSYLDCSSYVHENHNPGQLTLPELMEDFNIFWTPLFWLRWQFPEQAIFFVENGIFELDTVLGKLALSAWQEEPVDDVWIDCYHAMWLNNVIAALAAAIVAYVTVKMTVILVQTVVQVLMLTWYTYTSLGYITLAVENSVVIEEY